MGKRQSFADKAKKEKKVSYCPKCHSAQQSILYVKSEQSSTSGAWKFRQSLVNVCKCNQAEIYK